MNRWFFHEDHGFMLRVRESKDFDLVVSALCLNTAKDQQNQDLWENHKLRLHVNAGCGAICVDEMNPKNHNPDFKQVEQEVVPEWIKKDFLKMIS